jgi:hypothetical protein
MCPALSVLKPRSVAARHLRLLVDGDVEDPEKNMNVKRACEAIKQRMPEVWQALCLLLERPIMPRERR